MIKYNNSNINDWYYNSGITKVYYNGDVCYQKIEGGDTPTPPSPSGLPSGYTEVEYIENQDKAYLDINFYPNQNTRIITEMQTVTSTPHGRFLGCGGYDKVNAIQFDYENGSTGRLHIGWGAVAGWTTYQYNGDYNKHKYDWNGNEFIIDDGVFSASTTDDAYQCTSPLYVFSNSINGTYETGDNYALAKLYTFKLYDNGTLIRDLVPCTRDSDNEVGAYDIVNDVFYSCPRSGYSLVAGNPV